MRLSERADRARREFYRLLPHFVRLPSWENITTDLTTAVYADRTMRLWAVIARMGQSFPSTTAEESVKAALVGLDVIEDAALLACGDLMTSASRMELIDGMILSGLENEEDRELFRQPRAAAEYLVGLASKLGVLAEPNHSPPEEAPMMSTEKPKQPTFGELMEEYTTEEEREDFRRLDDPVKREEEIARIKREAKERRKKRGS